jgi:proline iminopeptidase
MYRVVLWDQRGVGKSRPRNELERNTTQHLSEDIERLREHLRIPKWHMVFGGSWGSTLGLFYTQAHPEHVGSLVVRGVLTARTSELLCNAQPVAAQFFPEEWADFLALLPEDERGDPMGAYYARITSNDPDVSAVTASQWNKWEFSVSSLRRNTVGAENLDDPDWSLTHALFEAHYLFQNGAWLEDGQLLAPENIEKMKHIPGTISSHNSFPLSCKGVFRQLTLRSRRNCPRTLRCSLSARDGLGIASSMARILSVLNRRCRAFG